MSKIKVKPRKIKPYNPHKRTAEILDYVLKKINSVPYRPSSRWAFYRVYQKFNLEKSEQKNFTVGRAGPESYGIKVRGLGLSQTRLGKLIFVAMATNPRKSGLKMWI